jgi:hypothetical protein
MSRIRIEDLPLPQEAQESQGAAKIYGGATTKASPVCKPRIYNMAPLVGPAVQLSTAYSPITTFVSVSSATGYKFSLFV